MTEKTDTFVYKLLDGEKTVYIGITNDPQRRKEEHEREGKVFTRLKPLEGPFTESEARKREVALLAAYRAINNGKNPKYNEDSDG